MTILQAARLPHAAALTPHFPLPGTAASAAGRGFAFPFQSDRRQARPTFSTTTKWIDK